VIEELYDDTAGYEDESGIAFAPGLTMQERKQGAILYNLFNELMGIIAVRGDPGMGKDVFGNYIQYNLKRYFPQKKIMRDERPRSLFGTYDGLFNEFVIYDDLKKMRDIAKGKKQTEMDELMSDVADDWIKGAGEIMLKNSILYLTEWHRYCYSRTPHDPMNKTMGAIHKTKRHLDLLLIGTTQLIDDLDKYTCKPFIDWRVTCSRSRANPTGFTYFVERVKYDRRADLLVPLPGRPFPISFDAGKPRSNMGEGKIVLKNPRYRPETEEERIVLDVIKEGCETYEEMVAFLDDEGDMAESEILATLKDLGLKLPGKRAKFIIWYPCYFHIYNSKSAPQLKTTVRVSD